MKSWVFAVVNVPYRVGSYQDDVHQVLAEQLLTVFRLYPHMVFDFHRDILDFLGNLRTLNSGGEHCYMHLVRSTFFHDYH